MSHSSPGFKAKPDNTRGMKELCVINVASYDRRDPGYILGGLKGLGKGVPSVKGFWLPL